MATTTKVRTVKTTALLMPSTQPDPEQHPIQIMFAGFETRLTEDEARELAHELLRVLGDEFG